jgi:hypothetical protein
MSDHAIAHDASQAADSEPLFDREELSQFDADDSTAGSAIGKMLTMFFVYTILAMGIAGYWTYISMAQ